MGNKIIEVDFADVPQISAKDLYYQKGNKAYDGFYKYKPKIESFGEAIKERSKYPIDRELLVRVLREQYHSSPHDESAKKKINLLLDSNTYTVTTAHQPALLLGPLYIVYKIISTINLSKSLKAFYPKFNFVPVFVSGGEDHDLEEVATVHLFGKDYTWEANEQGAVGRMGLEGIHEVIGDIKKVFGSSPFASELKTIIDDSLASAITYGEFNTNLYKRLFSNLGLIVLNMDDKSLKKIFLPYAIKELTEKTSAKTVRKTQDILASNGIKEQAHVRDINLFYLNQKSRDRIIEHNDEYNLGNLSCNIQELRNLLSSHPQNISPNVVMRPIYQELILPNLAYIGGGGEIAYWLERRLQFESFEVPFPVLVRRNSILIVSNNLKKNIEKMNFNSHQFFGSADEITKMYLDINTEKDYNLTEEIMEINNIFSKLAEKAKSVDVTLEKYVLSEEAKQVKAVNNISSKMVKAGKQKNEIQINKVHNIKNKLFPHGKLQERYESFIPFYLKYGKEWFGELLKYLDPLNKNFLIIEETLF